MNSSLFSLLNRLTKPLRSHRVSESRCYCAGRYSRTNLYSKISPIGNPNISVLPELDKWAETGKNVRVQELQRIIRDLRKRRRFKQALEVSEWMKTKGVCVLTPSDHAVQLDLVGKVHGLASAESYFNSMSEEDKTEKTYGALLNCYVRERLTDKSLSHMQKMKELGFASESLPYNDLMCLYTNIGQHEKVPDLLKEMKENGVKPDNFSYRICINSYGAISDIDGMERVFEEMESQPHIIMDWNTYAVVANIYTKAKLTEKAIAALKKSEEKLLGQTNGEGYNHLISLYGNLGNKDEVMRLWELQKSVCKRLINKDYTTILGSLVKLGDFEKADDLLKQWESCGNSYDFRVPNVLIIGYCQKGLVEKAEAKIEDIFKKGRVPIPNSYGILAAGYFDKGEMAKAAEHMKKAVSLIPGNPGWKPNPKVIKAVLGWLGDEGDVGEVEDFVGMLSAVMPMNREMYHALIKANIRGGKEVNELLNSMKTEAISVNEETESILSLRK
ncbi:pentatricopeptide repeat-containing protein At4g21705, mitochondrial-like [Tasmannia lanceolata]|uniref:pentatricopeptide repeat-containing protein At4g21705, mitochondrial-like n=1 Tax=Tasmannia lanceolata TaxID=3420 RepID=UPI004063B95E